MTSRIFLDSSLLVEYIKGTETHLLDAFRQSQTVMLYLSQTVVSEYLFYHLAELGQKAPRTLKENTKIAGILAGTDPIPFLELFTWLPDDAALLRPAVRLMATSQIPKTPKSG